MADAPKKLSPWAKLITPVADRALDRLMPVVEKKLDELKDAAIAELREQIPILLQQVMAMLPLLTATIGKEATEALLQVLFKALGKTLEFDPDLPFLSDNVWDVSEKLRESINAATPDGFSIGPIIDVFKGFGR